MIEPLTPALSRLPGSGTARFIPKSTTDNLASTENTRSEEDSPTSVNRERAPSYGVQNRCPDTPTMNAIKRANSMADSPSPPPPLSATADSEGEGVLASFMQQGDPSGISELNLSS